MEKLKEKLTINNIIMIIFILLLIVEHLFISSQLFKDDLIFSEALNKYEDIFNFVNVRYHEWSSRIIIEIVIVMIFNFGISVWKIFNIVMWTLLAKSITKICMTENSIINAVIYLLVLVFPRVVINNTGWVTTTMNYLWVISLGCYTISVIVDYIKQKEISNLKKILYSVACAYASNQEQMVVVIFLTFSFYLLYEVIKNKSLEILKSRKFIIFLLLITIVSLIFILTCPGNYVRKADEIEAWLPNFANFNFFQNLEIALTATMSVIFLELNTYYLTFTGICFIGILMFRKNIFEKIFSFLPFLLSVLINIFSNINKYPYILVNLTKERFQTLNLLSTELILTWIDCLMYLIMIYIVVFLPVMIYYIFEDKKKSWICIFTYMLGGITRVIMGFTPTIFSSGERTFIFLYVSLTICTAMVLKEILTKYTSKIIQYKEKK